MTAIAFTFAGVLGTWLLAVGPRAAPGPALRRLTRSEAQAGRVLALRVLRGTPSAAACAGVGFAAAWSLVGGIAPAAVAAAFAGTVPARVAAARQRQRIAAARQAWPRVLAHIRVQVEQAGDSIPSALFAAGAQAPARMREAFREAARTWALSTDFELSLRVLKAALADPAADAVCETLLAAHRIGAVPLSARLRALSEAVQAETAALAEARAKQAGARFARGFVVAVPVLMALVGWSIGRGRAAYLSPGSQALAALSVLVVAGCWVWAGRIMSIPERARVFER